MMMLDRSTVAKYMEPRKPVCVMCSALSSQSRILDMKGGKEKLDVGEISIREVHSYLQTPIQMM